MSFGEHLYPFARSCFFAGSSPRVRGTLLSPCHGSPRPGSSPRVRGTRIFVFCHFLILRFIPACAGNTLQQWLGWVRHPVHPRVCGEHVICYLALHRGHGSSPRVRGTLWILNDVLNLPRFIPACAGNTPPRRRKY